MSAANPYGIFARSIDHNFDMSLGTIQRMVRTDEHAERIVKLAALTAAIKSGRTPEEEEAFVQEDADMHQYRANMRIKRVRAALSTVESLYTVYHRCEGSGEGFEAPMPISDARSAGELAYAVLMLA